MNKKWMVFCTVVVACAMVYGEDGPKQIIMKKDSLLKNAIALYDKAHTPAARENVSTVINGIFNFSKMGQKALPKPVWDAADSARRTAFVYQFTRMLQASSVKKLEVYQSDSTLYDLTENGDYEATVSAMVWYKGRQTKLLYKMTKNNAAWTVWDLIINDLSTVRNYREQFKTILDKKSLSDLIEILKKKADSYEIKPNDN
jgi:phospholipid transport system substrate-binding protein